MRNTSLVPSRRRVCYHEILRDTDLVGVLPTKQKKQITPRKCGVCKRNKEQSENEFQTY